MKHQKTLYSPLMVKKPFSQMNIATKKDIYHLKLFGNLLYRSNNHFRPSIGPPSHKQTFQKSLIAKMVDRFARKLKLQVYFFLPNEKY